MSSIQPPSQSADVIDAEDVDTTDAELIDDPLSPDSGESQVIDAELIGPDRAPGWIVRCWRLVTGSVEWLFGVISLIVLLAAVATIPILQLLSLGYLLEASGRVARSGRLRDGFVGVRKAARIGSLVLGTWLVLLPLRILSRFWYSAYLIDGESPTTRGLRIALTITTVLAVAHIAWAWYRGGRFRHFIWPAPIRFVKRMLKGGKYVEARDAVWEFVSSLELPYYFWLGLRGFAGAMLWLFFPITLFIGATTLPPGPAIISGFIGALMLAAVVTVLPFLQAQFAAKRRLVAMFDLKTMIQNFYKSPIVHWLALMSTLLLAIPLYLLKIELTPQEVALLPSLLFVVSIFPARLLAGWATGRATRMDWQSKQLRRLASCFLAILTATPVVGFYLLVVFFTRYTSWHGVWSTFEQHAFLVPVPFIDL